MSSATLKGANTCAQCSQVAAYPWPELPVGLRRRTEEVALHRRSEDAQTPRTARRAPRVPP